MLIMTPLIMAVISRLAPVSARRGFARVCFFVSCFFSSLKAQEIDVPLAPTGRLAAESQLHMFSPQTALKGSELGRDAHCRFVVHFVSLALLSARRRRSCSGSGCVSGLKNSIADSYASLSSGLPV